MRSRTIESAPRGRTAGRRGGTARLVATAPVLAAALAIGACGQVLGDSFDVHRASDAGGDVTSASSSNGPPPDGSLPSDGAPPGDAGHGDGSTPPSDGAPSTSDGSQVLAEAGLTDGSLASDGAPEKDGALPNDSAAGNDGAPKTDAGDGGTICVPDCTSKACGAGDGCGGTCAQGTCGSGQVCVSGACACTTSSCNGCCSGTTCEAGTADDACGQGGAACTTCAAGTCGSGCGTCGGNGKACCANSTCTAPLTCGGGGASGICGCTPDCSAAACGGSDGCGGICMNSPCPEHGQTCNSGVCVCDSAFCYDGCCQGTTCMPGNTTSACGPLGGACSICGGDQACLGGGACTDPLTAVAISCNNGFAPCALTSAGTVFCWPNGTGFVTATPASPVPMQISGVSNATAVSAGPTTACAIVSGGALVCWGDDTYGQLGGGLASGPGAGSSTPVQVTDLTSGVKAVSMGPKSACAITSAGSVVCWGDNTYGQLGNATTTNSAVPVPVTGLTSGAQTVSVGNGNACAVNAAGGVECWGNGVNGVLGDGSKASSSVPVAVTGLTSGVTALSVSQNAGFACAVANGNVWCWGTYHANQLDGGATGSSDVPYQIAAFAGNAVSVSAGFFSVCATTTGGDLQCWGENGDDANGGGGTEPYDDSPVQVIGLTSGVTSFCASYYFACAVTGTGGVRCWGYDGMMELGDGNTTTEPTPVPVLGFP